MAFIPPATQTPDSAIIRQAEDYRRQEEAERKKREEEHRRALDAERRRKLSETSQKR
ncbi:hypothetical protein AGMMS49983_20640 [Clostridia bacterium]|nr:hypothetical protein AGMMS49983_20640 [Clostridia bacterium]